MNEDLLDSTRSSTLYLVVNYNKKQSENELYRYILCITETNTILQRNYYFNKK